MWRRTDVALAMPPFVPKPKAKRRSRSSGTASLPPLELTGTQRELFDALKEARREAAEERGVPAYRIASNNLLEALLNQPSGANRDVWLSIRGVGQINVDPLREVFEPVFESMSG